MDATKKPLLIPPEFANYAEKHGIFQIYERLLSRLIVEQPTDPLTCMIDILQQEESVPQIVIHGPPGSGKRSMAVMISKHLDCVCLNVNNIISESESKLASKVRTNRYTEVPTHIWVNLIAERIKKTDCLTKGWLLEGFPQTREQALALQVEGIIPSHFILLDCPDTVLIERVMGKRVDPETGDVYHTTFDPPSDPEVVRRLVPDPKCTEAAMVGRLMEYHRHIDGILACYENIYKTVNADQPKADVFSQVLAYIKTNPRSQAPHTPRVVLLGPTGCGKSVQAELLASKYGLINVSCTELIKQSLADGSKIGESIQPYIDRKMMGREFSDKILNLSERTKRDFLVPLQYLHGTFIVGFGYIPEVVFMDIPNDTILERLTLRSIDPVTGERYHLIYNPPRSSEVKDRLQRNKKDQEDEVNDRTAQYQAYIEEIAECYEEIGQHINADQDIHTVFECIESIIVNRIPRKV
ncbi:predicted protein [Nematostella vectensis]|uniref:Adenylate kinase 8 n=1 Tax=Nematostella vectensis TaxID=45351 RepID=A7RYZ3_NEMVE|nr:predicted protein [Nematostella vectensis]|eukprot:XP_001635334.1 predicted protein [Nematostella vectensis]